MLPVLPLIISKQVARPNLVITQNVHVTLVSVKTVLADYNITMNIGVIGLGRMGGPIAKKLNYPECNLIVYDIDPSVRQEFKNLGIKVAQSISELSAKSQVIWVMVSANAVDTILDELCNCTGHGTIIVDGGNSHYIDTIRRAKELEAKGLILIDCGTSGGLWGAERGFSLTVGGDYEAYKKIEENLKYLAASSSSYVYVGPSGSGHYVKMVHNGIEYALLQAYAEGFHLLHNGYYKDLDLAAISATWLDGAVIRSWILNLAHNVLTKDQEFEHIKGTIGENGTGRWCVEEAHARHVPVKLIEDALEIRRVSRVTGGNYATKLIALVRHEMGGHPFELDNCDMCKEVLK